MNWIISIRDYILILQSSHQTLCVSVSPSMCWSNQCSVDTWRWSSSHSMYTLSVVVAFNCNPHQLTTCCSHKQPPHGVSDWLTQSYSGSRTVSSPGQKLLPPVCVCRSSEKDLLPLCVVKDNLSAVLKYPLIRIQFAKKLICITHPPAVEKKKRRRRRFSATEKFSCISFE